MNARPHHPESRAVAISRRHREAATHVVEVLQRHGYIAYFAGGSVRDELLGQHPKDYDVATDAHPLRVLSLFDRAHLVGEAFGVVLVRLKRIAVEVATFRAEWGYADGRHPDHVQYADARTDAFRRDFTINGLFFDPVRNELHDFIGGRDDLNNKIIRAIGRPDERFAEDYLRMMRAVRFTARLGFQVEPDTQRAIMRYASKLAAISRERVGVELQLMLSHATRADAATLLHRFRLDTCILNEPNSTAATPTLAALHPRADYPTALGAWMIDRHLPPERFERFADLRDHLRTLKVVQRVRLWRGAMMLSNDHRDALQQVLLALPDAMNWPHLGTPKRKRLLAMADWPRVEHLLRALLRHHPDPALSPEALDADIASLRRQDVAPAPLITGDDLIAAGLRPGPAFKSILDAVYDLQLDGQINDARRAVETALSLAEQFRTNRGS